MMMKLIMKPFRLCHRYFRLAILVVFLSLAASCNDYLDVKPSKSTVTPSSLEEVQTLLDNYTVMNSRGLEYLELLADNYYLTDAHWRAAQPASRSNYIWDDQDAASLSQWTNAYQSPIYQANVALDVLPTIAYQPSEQSFFNSIKGAALFHRAFTFYQLSQLYCRPYSPTATTDPGIVLRLTAAIETPSKRATVQETYDQIIADLKLAAELLPETSTFPTQPSKAAAYGTLARVYLSMRLYKEAGEYADRCLRIRSSLMDFNDLLQPGARIAHFNPETIFYHYALPFNDILYGVRPKIDTMLYKTYSQGDLRKTVFYQVNTGDDVGSYRFRGAYDADYYNQIVFDGITVDELFLVRAEAHARAGNTAFALQDLNTLMVKRWANDGSWLPFTASTASEALEIILIERRKELVYRGLRWSDLRRFNLEGANITLKRVLDGVEYSLPPNDPRWVLLIPQEVMARTNMEQNPR